MRHPAPEPIALHGWLAVGTAARFVLGNGSFRMPPSQGSEARTGRPVVEKAQQFKPKAVRGRKRYGLADGQRPEKTLLLCADPHLRGRHD